MEERPRLCPGAGSHADTTVGAGLAPDSEAGPRIDGPFLKSSHNLFPSIGNGTARTAFCTDLAVLTKLVDTDVDRPIMG